MNEQQWRPVIGYEGLYRVSDMGAVASAPRKGTKGRLLARRTVGKGHLQCVLYKDGVRAERMAHHLVLEAFVGPRPIDKEANHKNGLRDDNRLDNLEWITHRENVLHAYNTGLTPRRFSEDQIRSIRNAKGYKTQTMLGQEFGVSDSLIRFIWQRRRYAHVA